MRTYEDLQLETRIPSDEAAYSNIGNSGIHHKEEPEAKGCLIKFLVVLLIFLFIIGLTLTCVLFIFYSGTRSKVTVIDSKIDEILRGFDLLCGKDWTYYGLKCYFRSLPEQTWALAKKDCEDMNSDLIIINGEDEMVRELSTIIGTRKSHV
ncbi:CD209 antigen-like protein D [Pyxicephalus adspersus]|uniref:CD209 antigen-like protein D n=1 Tax=Pyxicephalus adspersus TaxID=30357 RepID=UPI003B5C044C